MDIQITIGAPQAIWLAWSALVIVSGLYMHGRPRAADDTHHNGLAIVVVALVELIILRWGGFF